jgi:hypothetical protein
VDPGRELGGDSARDGALGPAQAVDLAREPAPVRETYRPEARAKSPERFGSGYAVQM